MTKREFLTKIAAIEDVELAEFAQAEIAKLDAANPSPQLMLQRFWK